MGALLFTEVGIIPMSAAAGQQQAIDFSGIDNDSRCDLNDQA